MFSGREDAELCRTPLRATTVRRKRVSHFILVLRPPWFTAAFIADTPCVLAMMPAQGGEDVTDEPVREQAILDAVQGHHRRGLLNEGHRH